MDQNTTSNLPLYMVIMNYSGVASKGFPINDIPSELLVRILFFLDGYTLNSVLEAFPQVCDRCVLVTDRPQRALFVAPGLRCVQLSSLPSTSLSRFIKLYEIEDADGALADTFDTLDLRETEFYKSLNRFSFVHFATPNSGRPKVSHLIHEVFLTGATAEISHCPLGKLICGSGTAVDLSSKCRDETSLILRGFTHIENFEISEKLKSLTIVFGNCDDETVPSLHNVGFYRLPIHLNIVYYDCFPEIYDIRCQKLGERCRVLELVHAPSMKTHIEGPFPLKPGNDIVTDRTKEFFKCPFPDNYELAKIIRPVILGEHFPYVNLIGGPTSLYEKGQIFSDGSPRHDYAVRPVQVHIKQTFRNDIRCTTLKHLVDTRSFKYFSFECSFFTRPPVVPYVPANKAQNRSRGRFHLGVPKICNQASYSLVYHTTRAKYWTTGDPQRDIFLARYNSGELHRYMCYWGVYSSMEKALHFRDLAESREEVDILKFLEKGLITMMQRRRLTRGTLSAVGFDPSKYEPAGRS